MIAIRTTSGKNTGIGHLARMSYIANILKKNNQDILFILDSLDDRVSMYINNFNYIYLYDTTPENYDEALDAQKVNKIISQNNIDLLIVDNYKLNLLWEKYIKESSIKLCVIDDIKRKHHCDFIIDHKYTGETNTYKRYDNLVPNNCIKLLGPKYSLLNPDYTFNCKQDKLDTPTIMFNLGGGGDLSIFNQIINELLNIIDTDINILIVIGPLSFNRELIFSLEDKYDNIKTIQDATSLYKYYLKTSLYIGSLGSSLYELNILKIPALTFSLATNQDYNSSYLEDSGHYLHLDFEEFSQSNKSALLIKTLISNIDRLTKLKQNIKLNIDNDGVNRICNYLCNLNIKTQEYTLYNKTCIIDKFDTIRDNIMIRKANDSDINHYLNSRNISQNKEKMVVTEQISKIEHYSWWFSNKRQSYLVTKNNTKQIYIWDQKVTFKNDDFLIGGWFVCSDKTEFDTAFLTLKWQIDMTAIHYKNITWLAIINKDNKYVNALNKRLKFTAVINDTIEYNAIRKYFNNPKETQFNYLKRVF